MIMILASFPGPFSEHAKAGPKKGGLSSLRCVIVFYGYIEHIYMQKADQIGFFICVSQKDWGGRATLLSI